MQKDMDARQWNDSIYHFAQDICKQYVFPRDGNWAANIKRSLRNSDGTGVLIGVTCLGSVQGYMILDGERIPMPGRLYYRGIDIRQIIDAHIAEKKYGFGEIIYLLLIGRLPTAMELVHFDEMLVQLHTLPEGFETELYTSPKDHLMSKMACLTQKLYSYDENPDDNSVENLVRQSLQMIALTPTLAIHNYHIKRHVLFGEPLELLPPRGDLSLAENILYMLRPNQEYTQEEAHLLDLLLTIHAEHGGGSPSTFACRVLSSIGTDIYGALAAAINAFKGSRDSGVGTKVLEMYDDIRRNVPDFQDEDALADYLRRIREGEANDGSGKIYGLGHTIYTQSDPRAILIKHAVLDLAEAKGFVEHFRNLEAIERVGLNVLAENQPANKVRCANVDMYAGMAYRMLNIPEDMFAPINTIAHMPGWCAHRIEEVMCGENMMRPAYRAVAKRNDYVSLAQRG